MDLHRLFDFDMPTVQASLEFLLKVAISSYGKNQVAGKALLGADTKRKLFSGRPFKLLEAAVILEDEELVQDLIGKGVLVDHSPSVNEFFIRAIMKSQVELVCFWLQHGENLEMPEIIETVYESGSLEIMKLILNCGALEIDQDTKIFDFTVTEKGLRFCTKSGRQAAHYEMLSLLLKTRSGKQFLSSRDLSSRVLNSAAVNGRLDIVQCLVEFGADVNHVETLHKTKELHFPRRRSTSGQSLSTPIPCLFAAAAAGKTKVVRFLIDNNAEVNYQLPSDHPRTALEAALLAGYHNIASLLLRAGAICDSLYIRTLNGLALTEAAKEGDLELVRNLLTQGANPNFILDAWEAYSYFECYNTSSDLLGIFLSGGGEASAKGARSGISALQFAILMRDFKTAKSMIEAGAQLFPLKWNASRCLRDGPQIFESTLSSHSIFQLAVIVLSPLKFEDTADQLWFLRFLLEIGPGTDFPQIKNHSGPGILQQAIRSGGKLSLVRFLVEEAGADVNYASFKNRLSSPLEIAARRDFEIVKYLLSVDADVDGRYGVDINNGEQQHEINRSTALQWATSAVLVDMKMVQTLLEHGADVNAPGGWGISYGCTALQGAARQGRVNLVHFLLQRGADVNAAGCDSKYGRTALERAAECGHLDTVQLLLEAGATKLEFAAELAEKGEFFVIANFLKAEIKKRVENGKRVDSNHEDLYH